MELRFSKMVGTGNDFVVCAAEELAGLDTAAFALYACNRHYGVGSDGLLVISHGSTPDSVFMKMHNPDGTEDICGNGMRCTAAWARQHGLVQTSQLTIETSDGPKKAVIHDDGRVTVDMGVARYDPALVPYLAEEAAPLHVQVGSHELTLYAVSTGSTHAVWFCDELPDDELFYEIGPAVENHPLFPQKTSLMCVKRLNDTDVQVRIWERGACETLGCGTGACAAAVVSMDNGLTGPLVRVRSKGGEAVVERMPDGTLTLTGEATLVYEGRLAYDPDRRGHQDAGLD
ncbi:MAG: diaminopimelate epimerase [Armatimonadota bacterium]